MSILSALKYSITTLVLLTAIAVPVHARIFTGDDVVPGGNAMHSSPWDAGGSLFVGKQDFGFLILQTINSTTDHVLNEFVFIGFQRGSRGIGEVCGQKAQWINSEELAVGFSGKGDLVICDGGLVENALGFIGTQSGSKGYVDVEGSGSLWRNSRDLSVGNRATAC